MLLSLSINILFILPATPFFLGVYGAALYHAIPHFLENS